MTENGISELEHTTIEFIQSEQQRENKFSKNEQSLRDLWNNNKKVNVYIISVPEEEERELN